MSIIGEMKSFNIFTGNIPKNEQLAAAVITYKKRSAIRDVGKALNLPIDLIEALSGSLAWWDKKEAMIERFAELGIDPQGSQIQLLTELVTEILGFPRHLTQHVGGFVISRGPLSELCPIENTAMQDRTCLQWDKDDIDALGLLKVDVLALGMLTAIRGSLELALQYQTTYQPRSGRYQHPPRSIAEIPPEDSLVYDMLCQGDAIGVFQVESRAQLAMLPRLKPRTYYDLVVEVAIVRPDQFKATWCTHISGDAMVLIPKKNNRKKSAKFLIEPWCTDFPGTSDPIGHGGCRL